STPPELASLIHYECASLESEADMKRLLASATYFFCFMLPSANRVIEELLFKYAQPNATIITHYFSFTHPAFTPRSDLIFTGRLTAYRLVKDSSSSGSDCGDGACNSNSTNGEG